MILKLLTGGIDLPKLAADVRVLRDELIAARDELVTARGRQTDENNKYTDPYASLNARLDDIEEEASDAMLIAQGMIRQDEAVNKALADHIVKAHERAAAMENLIASRALAEDVETLRLKLERYAEGSASVSVAASLSAQVAGLSAKVEALTAAKLSEVKARKAPKKSG